MKHLDKVTKQILVQYIKSQTIFATLFLAISFTVFKVESQTFEPSDAFVPEASVSSLIGMTQFKLDLTHSILDSVSTSAAAYERAIKKERHRPKICLHFGRASNAIDELRSLAGLIRQSILRSETMSEYTELTEISRSLFVRTDELMHFQFPKALDFCSSARILNYEDLPDILDTIGLFLVNINHLLKQLDYEITTRKEIASTLP